MPGRKPGSHVPRMRPHKGPDGRLRARVRLGGRDHYLGPWGSAEATRRYNRVVSEWLAAGGVAPPPRAADGPLVEELLAAFLAHAERHYRKRDKATAEWYNLRTACASVRKLYADLPAAGFGCPELLAVREEFLRQRDRRGKRWSRGYVNEQVNRVRRVWSWGVERGSVPAAVADALRHVKPLRRTRTEAPEGRKVRPVTRAALLATLPLLRPALAALCRFHYLVGCRASEACVLRPCDLDRDADPQDGLWRWRPVEYKTEHVEDRPAAEYWLNADAQAVAGPWLDDCLTPESWAFPTGVRRKQRSGRGCYTKDSYNLAVRRAVARNNRTPGKPTIPHWSVGRVRHLRLTEVREAAHAAGRHGGEAAQAVGGHAEVSTTDLYAERGELARQVLRDMAGGK
jgi:integrase